MLARAGMLYSYTTMPTKRSDAAGVDPRLLTAEDFLEWLVPGRFADLIDGEAFMHSPVSLRHADLLNFLETLLHMYIERYDLGVLHREAVAVRLSARNVFLPDLAFIRKSRQSILGETFINGAPDLIVEVLSSRTAARDMGPKFAEYEEHGVAEYWILDPETLDHRFYRREGELLVEHAQDEPVIRSTSVPGFFVRRNWLDPGSLPKVAECLEEVTRGRSE